MRIASAPGSTIKETVPIIRCFGAESNGLRSRDSAGDFSYRAPVAVADSSPDVVGNREALEWT